MIFRRNQKKIHFDPEEVFIDGQADYEKTIVESPIRKNALQVLAVFVLLVVAVFGGKLFSLQIAQGSEYSELAQNNRLTHSPIVADRGVLFDRTGEPLAWNESSGSEIDIRMYTDMVGSGHIIGYARPPAKDDKGFFYRTTFEGVTGAESVLNERLTGENGTKIIEHNVLRDVVSENVIDEPEAGENIHLSIDAEISKALFKEIQTVAKNVDAIGGAGVLMDVHTGEVFAMTSFPEVSPSALAHGDEESIENYNTDPRNPYMNRALGGAFTPGSIVKPFVAVGALEEGVIDPGDTIISTGKIVIPNPYYPELPSVFHDWKAHGRIDMREAIAVSSNEYFYQVGGGYKDQEGIGIEGIEKYMHLFGFGSPTGIALPGEREGVVPNPEWKAELFDGEPWRLGDTYHTAIGQYGFLVTPLQAAQAVSALANGGTLITPTIIKGEEGERVELDVEGKHLEVVREGMRLGVVEGIARALKFDEFAIAAKTGTAEVGAEKGFENSWIVGFFPYEDPQYAFATVIAHRPEEKSIGAAAVMRRFFQWMYQERPEYLGL